MDVEGYLARIGAARPAAPTAEALADLHERHVEVVPFENLSVHAREPIVLEDDALVDKIVRRRRGGFCYELNGAFAALLRELGFPVTLLAGGVFGDDRFGPPFDHLALRVDLDEPWLADVGFGRFARRPLRLDAVEPQEDREGEFLVLDGPHGDLDVHHDGKPVYRLERRPRELREFDRTAWWQATSPQSPFTRNLLCTLPTPEGRVTLADTTLVETTGGKRVERKLDGGEVVEAYRSYFGIELDETPKRGTFG